MSNAKLSCNALLVFQLCVVESLFPGVVTTILHPLRRFFLPKSPPLGLRKLHQLPRYQFFTESSFHRLARAIIIPLLGLTDVRITEENR
jgi:hypothetical protein